MQTEVIEHVLQRPFLASPSPGPSRESTHPGPVLTPSDQRPWEPRQPLKVPWQVVGLLLHIQGRPSSQVKRNLYNVL